MAIIASKGPVDVAEGVDMDVRSVVDAPKRSPADEEEAVEDWICEAE